MIILWVTLTAVVVDCLVINDKMNKLALDVDAMDQSYPVNQDHDVPIENTDDFELSTDAMVYQIIETKVVRFSENTFETVKEVEPQ
ncbi:hypothetical protein RN001_014851 [Aquatica leii]|uniref:Uncharacterized protein n=1 Tax=Aquatica leii TaxID=1421715 RepID=A0AAN7SBQ9_9COLE|nr:hypothetical protein RN001_014851 [Aquatica leii]